MTLNSSNIEKLVLFNSEITNNLPNLSNEISQWKLGQIYPKLKPLAQKLKIDILNKLTNEDLLMIQTHLKLPHLKIEKLNYNLVKNNISTIHEIKNILSDDVLLNNFCIYRNDQSLYVSSWR